MTNQTETPEPALALLGDKGGLVALAFRAEAAVKGGTR